MAPKPYKFTRFDNIHGPKPFKFMGFPTTFKDPAGNLRFRTGFGPKAGPNQTQHIQHGTHKPAHNDSEISTCFDDNPKN